MSKSLESLCSSTIKYTTSNNIVSQIQQGQLPEDQSEPQSTNAIRYNSIHQNNPLTLNNHQSQQESGEIIFQTVLEKNIRGYDISPEKKKKKIHKLQSKQRKQKQKERTYEEKSHHEREKKVEKKSVPLDEPEVVNSHKNAQFQPNSSYFNPYMYNFQVPPINHVQPHNSFPQPYSMPYMHHNQYGYPNQMPMVPMNHPSQPMTMPQHHNPYLIPGPMIQMPQAPSPHLPPIPMNPYKQHSLPNPNHSKQFANHDKNENIKNQGMKQVIYQNSNVYQNSSNHQNVQNNHNYMNYNNFNQNTLKSPNQSSQPNYNPNNAYQNQSYQSNNYPNNQLNPNSNSYNNKPTNNNSNQSMHSSQYMPSNNNNTYSSYQSNSHNSTYNQEKSNKQAVVVQPYESQRDKKRNRFQELKQEVREMMKEYEVEEREEILQVLKCLVKYSLINQASSNYQGNNKDRVMAQGLALSCYQKNLSKIEKIYEIGNTKSQMLQKILSLLDLSELIVKIKQRKLQKLIITPKDVERTRQLMQKFLKDPRRIQK